MDKFSLKGKVALVTGATRGMGEATVLGFAEEGADIALAGRKVEELQQVADKVKKMGRKVLVVTAHLGHLEEIQPMVDKVAKEFGKIDILVNNAGTNPALSSTLEMTEKLWDAVMNLNLKGLFFLSQSVAKVMKQKGGGNIINVASIAGVKPELNSQVAHVYSISKAGVIMATQVMAIDLAPFGIRVNCIAPGLVTTKMSLSGFEVMPGRKEMWLARTPLKRLGAPEDVVGAMVYFASDASAWVTGKTLEIDGGALLT
ncbi:MAG: SDR family oxidoreductase [Dehalococcoidales bacterium]|nr:SDR family oxidoreductase [Dehalococcoidales bacterium]